MTKTRGVCKGRKEAVGEKPDRPREAVTTEDLPGQISLEPFFSGLEGSCHCPLPRLRPPPLRRR